MKKNIIGFLLGMVVGWVSFTAFQLISYLVSPKPIGMDFEDMTMVKELMSNMPLYSWLLVILGYAVGSFGGGFVIGKLAESVTKFFPVLLAIVFMVGWLVNIMNIPHPIWIVVPVFLVFIPFSLAGHRLGVSTRGPEAV